MNAKKESLRERSDRYLRRYQKLSIYTVIPFCLDFFALIIGTITGNFFQYFSLGVSRFSLDFFKEVSLIPLVLLPSFGMLLAAFALCILGAKGKAFAPFVSAAIYLGDLGALIAYIITHFEGLELSAAILSLVAHGIFLVLYVFWIVYLFKTLGALKAEHVSMN